MVQSLYTQWWKLLLIFEEMITKFHINQKIQGTEINLILVKTFCILPKNLQSENGCFSTVWWSSSVYLPLIGFSLILPFPKFYHASLSPPTLPVGSNLSPLSNDCNDCLPLIFSLHLTIYHSLLSPPSADTRKHISINLPIYLQVWVVWQPVCGFIYYYMCMFVYFWEDLFLWFCWNVNPFLYICMYVCM